MNISHLYNTTVIIERDTLTQGTSGEAVHTWATFATVKAALRQITGDERILNNRDSVISTHRLYIDTLAITEKDRVNISSVIYQIVNVNPMQINNNFMQLDLRIVK